ncbi:hypothetical protein ABEF92_007846 [Exophiala dermatitidis]|uniref:DUF7587 domain-containing protein n=1 Tax=Exophiala dermatitidis (strain ATCC 34100 / CBS 525.76 / NIH/UT8656) TaxID=858893 RepID=H6BNI0_EXODN|nr:uncharacterized protein HMPREF1120_00571 [Exophiala dermatitidis NIH/UT8656]EHY52357.1 hypothetical protein HMPREF1120_00571 [Exophiala dermatitidis NIH/UT8656]
MDARLRISFDNQVRRVHTHPRLLFRAFEPAHGLKARRFLDDSSESAIPPPPAFGTSAFRHLVEQHLREVPFSSPFLSWSQNPRRALDLIEKGAKPRFLAVIDYNDYCEELESRFGRGVGLWLVPSICQRYGFRDLEKAGESTSVGSGTRPRRRGYTGIGEFLSWGSVRCEPVAILGKGASLRLYYTMKSFETVDFISGVMLRQCLYGVRSLYREVLAKSLLLAFKKMKNRGGFAYRSFIRGIYGDSERASTTTEPSDQDDDWESLSTADDEFSSRRMEMEITPTGSLKSIITVEIPRTTPTSASQASPRGKVAAQFKASLMRYDDQEIVPWGLDTEHQEMHLQPDSVLFTTDDTENGEDLIWQETDSEVVESTENAIEPGELSNELEPPGTAENLNPAVDLDTADDDFATFLEELFEWAKVPTPLASRPPSTPATPRLLKDSLTERIPTPAIEPPASSSKNTLLKEAVKRSMKLLTGETPAPTRPRSILPSGQQLLTNHWRTKKRSAADFVDCITPSDDLMSPPQTKEKKQRREDAVSRVNAPLGSNNCREVQTKTNIVVIEDSDDDLEIIAETTTGLRRRRTVLAECSRSSTQIVLLD